MENKLLGSKLFLYVTEFLVPSRFMRKIICRLRQT